MANSDSIRTLKVRFHSSVGLLVTFGLMVVCEKVLCLFSAAESGVSGPQRPSLPGFKPSSAPFCCKQLATKGSAAGFENPGYAGEKQDS